MAAKKWPTGKTLRRLSPELLVSVHLPTRVAKCSDWHNLHNVGAASDLVLPEVRP